VSSQSKVDPLSNLFSIPGVASECETTLKAIDELMWNRTVRRHKDSLIPYTRRIAGFATAALDGAQMPKDPTMEPEVSPMGSLSDQGLLVTAEADLQRLAFRTEPLKVLARLHTFVSIDEDRGRPRTTNDVNDPLRLGSVPPYEVLQERMSQLVDLVIESKASSILVTAIAHAELATLRPFTQGNDCFQVVTSIHPPYRLESPLPPRGLSPFPHPKVHHITLMPISNLFGKSDDSQVAQLCAN